VLVSKANPPGKHWGATQQGAAGATGVKNVTIAWPLASTRMVFTKSVTPLQGWVWQTVVLHIDTRVPTQTPAPLHWSPTVQAFPSLQTFPFPFAIVQVALPLHVWVRQVVLVQLIAVPMHVPRPLQWSPNVQAFPSSHVFVAGALVGWQVDVPLGE